jgi:hypothetical protein
VVAAPPPLFPARRAPDRRNNLLPPPSQQTRIRDTFYFPLTLFIFATIVCLLKTYKLTPTINASYFYCIVILHLRGDAP